MVDRAPLERVCAEMYRGFESPSLRQFFTHQNMLNTLAKLASKPSDKNIRLIRGIFALIVIAVIYFGYDVTTVNFNLPDETKLALYAFPLLGLVRSIVDPGLMRKKMWKWTITGTGVLMLLISLFLIDDKVLVSNPVDVQVVSGEGVSIDDLVGSQKKQPFSLSTDNFFAFFGIMLLFVGFFLNNKNITTKNERHAEKVNKIRV